MAALGRPIELVDLRKQYLSIKEDMDRAIQGVIESCRFIGGPEVESLEAEISRYLGVQYAVGCASGTDALQLALMALKIGPGDEVITTPFTFVATAESIAFLGARPVFVDIDPRTYCIDPGGIEDVLTEKTKTLLPVHLYGQTAEWEPIQAIARRHGLTLIEDGAQAIGAEYNGRKACSLGDIGCLSFFPSKNLGAYGDGGMVTTNDPARADTLRRIRGHGSTVKYQHKILGVNSRLDAIQAAILRVKLPHMDAWNERRRQHAALYNQLLADVEVVTPFCAPGNLHVYHQYSIRVRNRGALQAKLQAAGVPTAVHYPIPLHLQEAFQYLGYEEGAFPVSEHIAREILSLPMYPELEEDDIRYIADRIREALMGSEREPTHARSIPCS